MDNYEATATYYLRPALWNNIGVVQLSGAATAGLISYAAAKTVPRPTSSVQAHVPGITPCIKTGANNAVIAAQLIICHLTLGIRGNPNHRGAAGWLMIHGHLPLAHSFPDPPKCLTRNLFLPNAVSRAS